jgi:hypothetical protein
MSVGRSGDDTSKEWMEILSDQVSKGGEHGNTAVCDLRLTVPLDFLDSHVSGESERIELAQRSSGAWKASTELG